MPVDFSSSMIPLALMPGPKLAGEPVMVAPSSSLISNLNADLWDGYQFADYLNQAVKTTNSPTFAGLAVGSTPTFQVDAVNGKVSIGAAPNLSNGPMQLTGVNGAESLLINSTLSEIVNYRAIRLTLTTNYNNPGGTGTASGGLFVNHIDSSISANASVAHATLGLQFTVNRNTTYANSGIAGTLQAIQGNTTNQGNYTDTLAARNVSHRVLQALLTSSPTINVGGATFTQYVRGVDLSFAGTPVLTSGALVTDAMGIRLTGTGNTVGSSAWRAFYSSVAGYDTNWTFYNDTANDNFLGNDNSKTYFGTGQDASVYYDAADLVINPREVGTGSLKVAGDVWPATDDTYYLGKNDDDSPFAWKGLILKDTTNGKYYRIEVVSGTLTATDLTD